MDNPIWAAVVDIETTGLSANEDVPLEIGVALIDFLGNVKASEKWLVFEDTHYYSRAIKRGMDHEFVGPMHTTSGLWYDIWEDIDSVTYTRSEVDDMLVEFLTANEVPYHSIPMFGNSIGSLDRPFCLVHFPDFDKALHYRNIDMSTIKELCKVLNPSVYEKLVPIIGTKADAPHRVMGDIEACLKEYQAYIDNFLFVDGID